MEENKNIKTRKLSELLRSEKRDDAVLSVNNLNVSFKTDEGMVHAVRGVSFDLYKGETLCIVGESGSGKSVTSKTIMGILSASAVIESGSIMYEGEDLTKVDESEFHRIRGHKIGMIFQDPLSSLNPIMRVGKQITEAMLVNKNRLKRMKDDIISKEEAAFKNIKVVKNSANQKAEREIEVSDDRFEKQIYALRVKLTEESDKLVGLSNEEYVLAKEAFDKFKADIYAQIKQLDSEKKIAHKELVKKARQVKKEANKEYSLNKKDKLPALKSKQKEAKLQIKAFKKEHIDDYWKEVKSLFEDYKKTFKDYSKVKEFTDIFKVVQKFFSDLDSFLHSWKEKKEHLNSFFKISKKEAKEKALQVMKEVGIPQPEIRFKQYPFEFSGGMRQRIVIAIALTANPDILICDEPTTALDVTIQAQILELINKLKRERNMSIIFITHDLGVVANMADRVAVMYAGKIVEMGSVNEIFYDPRHPYTWALLSSIPDLDSKEKLEAIQGTPPYLINPPKGDAFAARNKFAMQIDFEVEPPMFKVSETHYAATWLLDKRAPKTTLPKIVSQRIKISLERAGIIDDR